MVFFEFIEKKLHYDGFFISGQFSLSVEGGEFSDSEIIVMLGENGTGKTTMIRLLSGKLEPNEGSAEVCFN